MKDMVKNLLNKRKQEENKEEMLFIDSILDCELMDEEEVTKLTKHMKVLNECHGSLP